MTIKLLAVSSRVTPQLSILKPVSRNKRRPEEDSHLVRLSSKKKKQQQKKNSVKVVQMFLVYLNFNINTHRSAIYLIGRICFSFHVLHHTLSGNKLRVSYHLCTRHR